MRMHRLQKEPSKRFFVVFGIIAAVFSIGGVNLFLYDCNLRKSCSARVEAVVVENVRHGGSRSRNSVAPVFEYEFNGTAFRIESNVATYPPRLKVGERVNLLVNPENPGTVVEEGSVLLRLVSTVMVAVGALFLGTIVFVFAREKRA